MTSSPATPSATVDPQNPWLGLASFTEDTRAFFHGRDEEIAELSRRVQRKLLTVLFGQSGLGKTSILRAGVVPRLRVEGYCPVYVRIDYGRESPPPSEQIKQAVLRATAEAGTWINPGVSQPGETLWEFLHHRDDTLRDASGRTLTPLIIFDQFEEIFTLAQGDDFGRERAARFKEDLADLVENRAPKAIEAKLEQDDTIIERFDFTRADYRILISLREDYLPHLDMLKGGMPSITQNRMRLARMTGLQALDAVIKPGGSLVTEEVARAIVEFVAGARGGSVERLAELDVEPPLLSVICRELNERRRALGQAQITVDMVTGNRREILTDFYERSIADLPEAMRRFVEDKLLTKSGFRDNLALETALEEPGVTKPLIDTLVARRLLRIEDRLGTQRVELTHDVLADVVRASRDARQQRLALEQARERERRTLATAAFRTRRLRWIVAGLTLIVVGLSIGAVIGIRAQRRAAELAGQTDVSLGSRLLDEGRVADGLAHLVRAGRKNPNHELIAPRLLASLTGHNFALPAKSPLALPSPALWTAYMQDGRSIILQGEDSVVRVIDAAEWRIAREFKFDQPVQRGMISWSENPDMNAVMLRDGAIVIFDRTGKPRLPPIRPPGSQVVNATVRGGGTMLQLLNAKAFDLSPDGRWLAGTDDRTLWIWDTSSGELRATLPHNGMFRFSPDSRRIVGMNRGSGGSNAVGGRRAGSMVCQVYSVPEGTPVGAETAYAHPGSSGRFLSQKGDKLFILHNAGVQMYDVETGKPDGPLLRNNAGASYDCLLSPDGKRLVFLGLSAIVVELATGQPLYPPLEHGASIPEARFSRDGKMLFTNCVDGLFRVWDLETGKLLATPMWRQDQYTPAALSPDGRHVVVFTAAGPVYRMELGRGAAAPLELPRSTGTRLITFLPGLPARVLWFTATEASAIDIASGRPAEGGFPLPPGDSPVIGHTKYSTTAEPGDALFTPDPGRRGERVWILGQHGIANDVVLEGSPIVLPQVTGRKFVALTGGGSGSRTVGIWDLKTGRRMASIQARLEIVAPLSLTTFNPDETRIAFQTSDNVVHVCEVSSGKELFVVEVVGRETIVAFRFTPDGRHLLTGGSWGGIQVWDAATGKGLREMSAHRSAIARFDFSRDGRYYSSLAGDGTAHIWETASHNRISSIQAEAAVTVGNDFSWDGSRIVAPLGAALRVWDTRSGLPLTERLEHHSDRSTVAYSPDGHFVSAIGGWWAGSGAMQRIWSVPPRAKGRPTPQWLLALATICSGRRLTDEGKFVSAAEEFAKLDSIRQTVAALPANDPYAEWGRWFLSDDPNRPIAPGFTITPAEAKKLRDEMLAAAAAKAAEKTAESEQVAALTARARELFLGEKWEEAEIACRQLVERMQERGGLENRNAALPLYWLASALLALDKFEEAEPFARSALRLIENNFPAGSVQLADMRRVLGRVLLAMGNLNEAEPLLIAAYTDLKASGQTSAAATRETATALTELYTDTGESAKAAEWREKADAVSGVTDAKKPGRTKAR